MHADIAFVGGFALEAQIGGARFLAVSGMRGGGQAVIAIRQGEPPLSTLDDAADALRIIEAAEKSAKTGKKQTIAYA